MGKLTETQRTVLGVWMSCKAHGRQEELDRAGITDVDKDSAVEVLIGIGVLKADKLKRVSLASYTDAFAVYNQITVEAARRHLSEAGSASVAYAVIAATWAWCALIAVVC